MKSVLISIRPYWVFLIIAKIMGWNILQRKTVEVRKNYPKSDNWNKVAKIYCSKDKRSFSRIPKEYQPLMEQFLGKVIGEFACDKVFLWNADVHDEDTITIEETCELSCLSEDTLLKYADGYFYGWHISNLVTYDRPKELRDYVVVSKPGCCNEGKCRGCPHLEKGNGIDIEDDCLADFDTNAYKPLRRPPQSWCYVEELGNANT